MHNEYVTPEHRLSFSLNSVQYKLDLAADLRITPETFNRCLMRQAALLAYYASLYRTSDRICNIFEEDVEIKMAQWRIAVRASHPELKTVGAVEDMIKVEPAYKALREALIEEQSKRDMLKDAVDAFKARTQMLMKIGAKYREEDELEELGSRDMKVKERIRQSSLSAEKQAERLRERARGGNDAD